MRHNRSIIFSLLLLLGFSAQGWADADEPRGISDPVRPVEVSNEEARDLDGDAPLHPPVAEHSNFQVLTGKERLNLYLRDAFWSPGVFFEAAGPALGAQMNNEPPQWGQGMEGYSKRFANRFGRFALKGTYEAAGAALLQHEVRYLRSKRSGFLPRTAHALTANFVTYDRSGRRTTHVARVGSVIGAELPVICGCRLDTATTPRRCAVWASNWASVAPSICYGNSLPS